MKDGEYLNSVTSDTKENTVRKSPHNATSVRQLTLRQLQSLIQGHQLDALALSRTGHCSSQFEGAKNRLVGAHILPGRLGRGRPVTPVFQYVDFGLGSGR